MRSYCICPAMGNKEINTISSLADRSQLSTEMIIGRTDLQGFMIDPNQQFLNEPTAGQQKPTWSAFLVRASNKTLNNQIILLPILGALVVAIRLLIGVRTFGVFAPVVIALSLILMSPNILQGIVLYVFLISIGAAAKVLVFSKMQLPNVAEMGLIMCFIVICLVVFSFLPLSFQLTATTVFFPLIITTHLVERFSRATEEHEIADALKLLAETFTIAIFLTFVGNYLLHFTSNVLWLIFAIAMVFIWSVGNYTGLRLRELLRFKQLKK